MMDALSSYSGASFAARVDQHVGDSIRKRRIMLGLTQEQLADSLEISYQQIQKYETGTNRISAGRLFQIAECLQTEVGYFFSGLSFNAQGPMEEGDDLDLGSSSRNVIELVRNYQSIEDLTVRNSVGQLVRTLGSRQSDDEAPGANANGASNGSNGASSSAHAMMETASSSRRRDS